MLTLNDGRSELWQWDTGRTLTVDAECSQVHFSNKVFGRSIDVDVIDGVANIPDILLQTDKDLNVWAFVGTPENGYTKISKVFKVNRRNKPADYVFTPSEQTTLAELVERLDAIERNQDPDAIKNAVDDYLANNPIKVKETDPTVPEWAKQPQKPSYTAKEVGAISTVNGTQPDENGDVKVEIPVSDGLNAVASELLIKILRNGVYSTDQSENIAELAEELNVSEPEEPDEPEVPEVTLTSISAVYSGGDVTVGTAVTDLTGIVVTAHYSDGSTQTVTGYTLSGTIAEGSNTITVSYGGKTTTFTVNGVAESGGEAVAMIDAGEISFRQSYLYADDNIAKEEADTVTAQFKANGSNFKWYTDNGSTEVSGNSLTTRSGILCQVGNIVHSEDTALKILIHTANIKTYDQYIIGCTNWDGVSTPSATDVFYCQAIGSNAWTTGLTADHEETYTVKAGYRFFIAAFTNEHHKVYILNHDAEATRLYDNAGLDKLWYATISEAVFEEDATVRIAASGATGYGAVWAFCTDADGAGMRNECGYFTERLDSSDKWNTPYSFEGMYAVKAGYRLVVGAHWEASTMDEFKVEVV